MSEFIKKNKVIFFVTFFAGLISCVPNARLVNVSEGWAKNSVNTVVFRKNSIASKDNIQFISFYDEEKNVIIGKRNINSEIWEIKKTPFKGNADDAHCSISIMTDGEGYVHLAWGQHNNALNYAKSISPFSIEFSDKSSMIGKQENKVSYPEFYAMKNGDLLFFYRDGGSGNGNLIINKFSLKTKKWQRVQSNLIDGEGKRNAYWQAFVDKNDYLHISWVWRETPDVASNHDMCYAVSKDMGESWEKSTGEKYTLPITATNAEYACIIPQNSELINQTSMTTDAKGNPFIVSYWRSPNETIPQYRIIYKEFNEWKTQNAGFRKTAFSLSGLGTKKIPISRPQIIVWNANGKQYSGILFRDAERQNKVSIAINNNLEKNKWTIKDLSTLNVGDWEPTFDTELWKQQKLHLFFQKTEQIDAEGKAALSKQMIKVLQWNP